MKRRELFSRLCGGIGMWFMATAGLPAEEPKEQLHPVLIIPSQPSCPLCFRVMYVEPSSGEYPFKIGDRILAYHSDSDYQSCPNDGKVYEIPVTMVRQVEPSPTSHHNAICRGAIARRRSRNTNLSLQAGRISPSLRLYEFSVRSNNEHRAEERQHNDNWW